MSTVDAPPRSPYKGLAPFEDSELDALLFFGRERETEVIVANLLASRLTILYGPTGVGKSSILRAAVVRRLRETAPDADIVLASSWSGDARVEVGERETYVILDQFEEYFLYERDGGPLLDELPELLRRPRVHVLISMREDALAQLDAFKAGIPNLYANSLRLDHLDREAGRAAIVGPVERWNELAGERVDVDPELVEAVLDETATGRVRLGRDGAGLTDAAADAARIEAPYLQLVMERIWDAERDAQSSSLRLETLRTLGGATAIVRDHLRRALDALDADEKDVAARIFNHLVTPSGTKIAHRAGDLAQYASVRPDVLVPVLATLNRERILRTVDGSRADGERYEIFHDVLAEPVLAWRQRRQLERERTAAARRHRRLLALAIASLVALAAVAVVAVFALKQRSEARVQARHAHAGELAATALATLGRDPARSLQLALSAARIERNPRIEDVLRTALADSRLRLVLPAGSRVQAAALTPDAKHVVVGAANGQAAVYDVARGRRVLRLRRPGAVTAASFSPDGRRVLVADAGGNVLVRDLSRRGRPVVLRHAGAVRAAAFAGDGTLVVSGGDDGTARIWRADTGGLVREFRPGGRVTAVALAPGDRRLAVLTTEGQSATRAALYDVTTGALLLSTDDATAIAFDPDGTLLATGMRARRARLWSATYGGLLGGLPHGGGVTAVEFSPDGRRLLTAATDGALRVWDVGTQRRLLLMPSGTDVIESAHYSDDGALIVSAGSDGLARIWDARNGRQLLALAGHRDVVTSAAFSRSGRFVVSASDDGTARVWNTTLSDQLRVLGSARGAIVRVGFDASGRLVAAGSRDGSAAVWSLATRRRILSLRSSVPLDDARLSPDGALLATVGDDGTARVSRVRGGARVLTVPNARPGRRVEFAPGGGTLLAAGGDRIRLVSLRSRRPLAVLRIRGRITDARFGAGGTLVAAAGSRGDVGVWRRDGSPVRTVHTGRAAVVAVALSPDGKLIATAGADGTARLWSVASGRLQHRLRMRRTALTDVEFSADGRVLATAAEREARLWTAANGLLVHVLRGHHGLVASVAFSPDGRWLLTAGPTAVGVWHASSGRFLLYLRGPRAQVTSAAFARDGEHVVAGSADGTVRTYDCALCGNVYRLAHLARVRLSHIAVDLTPEQRGRYLGG